MRESKGKKLRVIKIMDPVLCMSCNQAYIADVSMSDGKQKKMFYCARLDCDNWITTVPSQKEVTIEDISKRP